MLADSDWACTAVIANSQRREESKTLLRGSGESVFENGTSLPVSNDSNSTGDSQSRSRGETMRDVATQLLVSQQSDFPFVFL